MKVQAINSQSSSMKSSPNFQANLWVDRSVAKIIKPNEDCFIKASRNFDNWLQNEQKHVAKTMHIRENTSLVPKVALERYESKTTYAYPFEECGYTYQEKVKKYEDLEFELGNRKCGFWFDPSSNEHNLLSDFKNMFKYLANNGN